MEGAEEFVHSKVRVKTHDNIVYNGTLLGLDEYLNTILQDVENTLGEKKTSLFIKGSNVLYVALDNN
ncbi:U6 snRNA-associated Sm-like protein LSm6 [Nematocida sp. AWRm77]|nr:U6 snRNA-associated Sm-like protein LSm6 [Nematocida sp. AWRm77]